jgi:hypothetical protein
MSTPSCASATACSSLTSEASMGCTASVLADLRRFSNRASALTLTRPSSSIGSTTRISRWFIA